MLVAFVRFVALSGRVACVGVTTLRKLEFFLYENKKSSSLLQGEIYGHCPSFACKKWSWGRRNVLHVEQDRHFETFAPPCKKMFPCNVGI